MQENLETVRKTFENNMGNASDSYVRACQRGDYETAARNYYKMVTDSRNMFRTNAIKNVEFLRIMCVLKRYNEFLEKICG